MHASSAPAPGWLRPLVDYGPLVLFFGTYFWQGLMPATAVIIVVSLVAALLAWLVERRLPLMPLVTAAVVALFGGLTLWLQDETFIKMKPTLVQAAFGVILLGSLAMRRPILKQLLNQVMPALPEAAWRQLTLRYAVFFLAMAVLNELVWRTQSTDVWVTFKVFGIIALTMAFVLAQLPFINRHAQSAAPAGASDPELDPGQRPSR
jgi:intracellular septation protein